MNKKLLSGALAVVVVSGGAFAALGNRAPSQQLAGESLDLLKTMGQRSTAAHAYIAPCVTAIAHAKRFETRKDAASSSIERIWVQAAGRCQLMASTVCEIASLQPPREACTRIRGFQAAL